MNRPGRASTLFVLVGLPASGKTTRARALAAEHNAVRLTPDEWMLPLFGHFDADGQRDVLEGRLVWLAMRVLDHGGDVVLDFGVWTRAERTALRQLCAEIGATCTLIVMDVEQAERVRRIQERLAATPDAEFDSERNARDEALYQAPDPDELTGGDGEAPPPGFRTWREWAAHRWPTVLGP